jgi:hypothetical protein
MNDENKINEFIQRSSLIEVQNASKVTHLLQRFESFKSSEHVNVPQKKPKPPKKPSIIRNESMRDSNTIDHRKGVIIRNHKLFSRGDSNGTNSAESSDSYENFYQNNRAK